MTSEEYIKKWLEGTLKEEEKQAFEKTDEYAFLSRMDNALQRFKAPEYQVPFEPAKQKEAITRRISWTNQIIRAAASVILVIGAITAYLYLTKNDEVRISSNQQSEIYLPDSSFVQLNKASLIAFDQDNWDKSRKVSLDGEAFFDVRKASQFEVVTSSGTVRVLGTQFNVKSREHFFEVSCFEGKVQVIYGDDEVFLSKNQAWRALDNSTGSVALPIKNSPDWVSGESHFESVPFKHVIEEFERQYEIKVLLKNIDTEQLYTGSFAHDNINLALKSLSLPLNIQFNLEGDQVVLSGDQ